MIAKAGVTILVSSFFYKWCSGTVSGKHMHSNGGVLYCRTGAFKKFKMNPILVMVLCGVANMVFCAAAGS